MRLAWFSPLPPVRTGIADVSAELVAALRARGHAIDAYPAESAHDFPWVHRQRPYDLIVYQFGNSSHHDYLWAYALRYPGLVVLHDACLHHARAAFLLRERRPEDYRAEFAWNHPDAPRDAAELAIAGMDSRLFYEWPMVRALVETARITAAHAPCAGAEVVRLGHGQLVTPQRKREARVPVRRQYGIVDEAVLFGLFGGLTPEKRIPQVLRAFAAVRRHAPDAHLLLGGARTAHYDVDADIAAHGLAPHVTVTGYLESEQALTEHLAACDVSLNLRWPTAREISGAWLRALAAGVPTVITDLAQLGHVPSLDPRTWVRNPEVRRPTSEARGPVSIAIDLVDEDHSLRLAMRRLAADPQLRAELGASGQAWWQREHSLEAMVEDYERLFHELRAVPATPAPPDLPEHLQATGGQKLRQLLEPFDLESPL